MSKLLPASVNCLLDNVSTYTSGYYGGTIGFSICVHFETCWIESVQSQLDQQQETVSVCCSVFWWPHPQSRGFHYHRVIQAGKSNALRLQTAQWSYQLICSRVSAAVTAWTISHTQPLPVRFQPLSQRTASIHFHRKSGNGTNKLLAWVGSVPKIRRVFFFFFLFQRLIGTMDDLGIIIVEV